MPNLMMSTSFPRWVVALGVSCREGQGAVSLWGEAPVEVQALPAGGDQGGGEAWILVT